MSGLYNVIGGGQSPLVPILCEVLRKAGPFQPGRFRDAWIADDGKEIVILTRTGGGNREEYESSNNLLAEHPLYISDADDSYDSTYANFRFRAPEDVQPLLAVIFKHTSEAPVGVQETFEAGIAAIKGENPPARAEKTAEEMEELQKAILGVLDVVFPDSPEEPK